MSGKATESVSRGACPLSIVVASTHSTSDLQTFLEALGDETALRGVEVIVADSGGDDVQAVTTGYPQVVLLTFHPGVSLPRLLGAGIKQSTGEIIAITDSTCPPNADWLERVLEAHKSPHPVIGGAVEINGHASLVDLAAYFCEYGQFMLPLAEGATNELPGNNLSFKRWALARGQEHVGEEFWKTLWCRQLQEEKLELVSAPSIVVQYRKSFRLVPFTVRRFHHGRCFAGMRMARASRPARCVYAVGSILLPVVLFLRTIRAVASKRRHLSKFLLSLPVSVLAITSWSVGEFFGYLVGPGESCARVH
jgi:hypothetical protein